MENEIDDKHNIHEGGMYAGAVAQAVLRPQDRKLYDPAVTFEEYNYYAERTREEQRLLPKPKMAWASLLLQRKTKHTEEVNTQIDTNLAKEENRVMVADDEWLNASRSFRTAGTGAIFYLITTDILGPFATPYAIGTLGYGPGVGLFTAFGLTAGYSGYLIWHVFMGVDSHEFPVRNYGDLAFRTWGTTARHILNFLQALALLLLLGQVTILFGGNIYELSKLKLCYIICPLIFVLAGFFLTQIRTLKNFGIFATLAIWLNLLAIFITMGVMAHSPPNYAVASTSPSSVGYTIDPKTVMPVHGVYPALIHYSGLPTKALVGSILGLLSGVLAYAGAQLFVEFLAEMRRPMDFLKAVWGAQLFIYTVYVVYGCYAYYFQGQYTYNPTYQGVSTYGWQTVGNVLTLISGLISAGLYGNIGIKVFYNNICCDLFGAPLLTSKNGKIFYALIVPIWWSIAFVIAAAIPAYAAFVGIISASCLLNMTYTIPPFLALGYDCQKRGMVTGDGFDPVTGQVVRTGTLVQRWMRGFFSGGIIRVSQNIWHVLYFLCSLGMCGLGMYASIEAMIAAFETPQVTSFGCNVPV